MHARKSLIGLGLMAMSAGLSAQTLDNSKLPKLEDIKPVTGAVGYQPGVDPFIHSWSVSVGYRDSQSSDKTRVTEVKEDGYSLGVGFRLGESWFGRVGAELAEQEVKSEP
ncbi:MAG TPA: hypothetical protein VFV57_08820, partial [Limnobacter sp.]|nr:hypothetical protein [Limnobacter sp.]